MAIVVLATVIPFGVASILMFNRLIKNERLNLRTGLMVNARTVSAVVDNEINTHAAIAATLAVSPALQSGDLKAFWMEARAAVAFVPGAWLALSDANGQILLNTVEPLGAALARHPAPEVIQKGFSTGKPQICNLLIGPVVKRLTGFVEVPVFKDGQPLYSISIALVPSRFYELIQDQFTHGEVVGIVDGNYRFVARIPDNDNKVGTLASNGWREAMHKLPEGWAENSTLEGNMSLTAYTRGDNGWSVGVARLDSDISKPFMTIFRIGIFATAGLTLLSFAVAALIARRTSRAMLALVRVADDLRNGRPVDAPPGGFAEINTVGMAIAGASAELAHRASRLEESNRRSKEALEALVAQRTADLVAEIQLRNETEATLRQTQKMETIGQLAGGIAHDFNNMLTIVLGNLDTLQRRLRNIENAVALTRPLEGALQGARNAAKLTHRLLAFSRQQPLEPQPITLNTLVSGLSDMLTRSVGEGVRIETVSGAGLWQVLADPNQLENCLVNLAVNARDAMSGNGKLTIESSNALLDEKYAARFGDLKPGQYVMLSVTDSGVGITADKLEKVFEPFFTTKETGKGTGLGLAMVHGFVKQSGGHIRIYSEVGLGTSVRIYLPRYSGPAIPVSPGGMMIEMASAAPAIAGETILAVEDDPEVRNFAVGALEDLGYQVIAAASGDEAIAILSGNSRVDVLFTDVVLGGSMDGRQLAIKAQALRPQLPVLFTTGYTRNAIVHNGRLDQGVQLLNKPYTQRELAEKIRAVITTEP